MAHCKMIAVMAKETTGDTGARGLDRSSSSTKVRSRRLRHECSQASTLKRRPSGKNQLQTMRSVSITKPPFSMMMLRLFRLVRSTSAKSCVSRVR
jgi:hypothetical protein